MSQIDVVILGALSEDVEDLRGELVRAKATLLYGDQILIESYKVSFLLARMAARARRLARQMAETKGFDKAMAKEIATDLERRGAFGYDQNADIILRALRGEEPEILMELPEVMAEQIRERGSGREGNLFRAIGTVAVVNYLRSHPRTDADAVLAAVQELVELSESRFVKIGTGGAEEVTYTEFDNIKTAFSNAVDRALQILLDPSNHEHPLFSADTRLDLRRLSDAGRLSGANFTRANRVELASRLIGDIPSFPGATVDELLDLREKIELHLARFRSVVAELEELLDADVIDENFDAAVDDIKQRHVEPAIEELNQSLRDAGAIQTLARATPTMSAGTLAMGAALAVGVPDLAGAVAVAAGCATAIANELLERHRQENKRKKNRLFLLFDVNRSLAARANQ